jgi:hypothetical protein
MTTPVPPFVAFLAVSGSTGGPGALYVFDDESGRYSAVNVLYEVTDSTGFNVFGPQAETVPLLFTDASGNSAKKIRSRIEDAVLSRLTANAGGPAQLVIGASEDNVSIVWVEG